ncbi:MAG: O-antigen ligase family protein [Proteobacteria bacterium]|nr:O-antigen ligase family protein [Pseudomonadota bacterium]
MEIVVAAVVAMAMAAVCILAVYPWSVFALLLMVPLIKMAATTSASILKSFDLTVLANILAGAVGLWAYKRTPEKPRLHFPFKMLLCLVAVELVFMVGLLWTSAPNYGLQKMVRLGGIGIPYLLLPAFFVHSVEDGRKVLKVLIFVGAVVAAVLIVAPQGSQSVMRYGRLYGRSTFFGSDPNTPATLVVAGMIALAGMVLTGAASRWLKYSSFLLALPFGLIAVLATGSRANLVGLLAVLPILSLFSGSKKIGKMVLLSVLALGALVLAFMLLPQVGPVDQARWFKFADKFETGDLAGTRSLAWHFCLTKAWDQMLLLGHGPGSYAVNFLMKDSPMWPHNIVLEALYEGGLFGAAAIVVFFVLCFRTMLRGARASRNSNDRLLVGTVSAVVLSMSVPALTHWDLDGARFLYLFAGLLHVSVQHVVQEVDVTDRDGENTIHSGREGYHGKNPHMSNSI